MANSVIGARAFRVIAAACVGLFFGLTHQTSAFQFQETIGGVNSDNGAAIRLLVDGYITAGATNSFGAGSTDIYLIKTGFDGTLTWSRTIGQNGTEQASDVRQTTDGGYIITGSVFTNTTSCQLLDVLLVKTDANGFVQWSRYFGGSDEEAGYSVYQTNDGGFVVAGVTGSFGAGDGDAFLIKTDALGNRLWSKTYGGLTADAAFSVVEAANGDLIFSGHSNSFSTTSDDIYLVRTDNLGNLIWSKTYGGVSSNFGRSVLEAANGDIVIAGESNGVGSGLYDGIVLRVTSVGNIIWSHAYGGTNFDAFRDIDITSAADPGFVMVGRTFSYGPAAPNVYAVKITPGGAFQWAWAYGGNGSDNGFGVATSSDPGYAFTGLTTSFGAGQSDVYQIKTDLAGVSGCHEFPALGDVVVTFSEFDPNTHVCNFNTICDRNEIVITPPSIVQVLCPIPDPCCRDDVNTFENVYDWQENIERGYSLHQAENEDYVFTGEATTNFGLQLILARTDESGNLNWMFEYGFDTDEAGRSVREDRNGEIVVTGYSDSPIYGGLDLLLMQTDAGGNLVYSTIYGGDNDDVGEAVRITNNNDYVVAGWTNSFTAIGPTDMYVILANSTGGPIWETVFGGPERDEARSIVENPNGEFVVAGWTNSFGAGGQDFFAVKLDAGGNIVWAHTYGGQGNDEAWAIENTPDGGYIIVGETNSFGFGMQDVYVVKIDDNGNVQWSAVYGGEQNDIAHSVRLICDGEDGYIISGVTDSFGAGLTDGYLIAIDPLGNLLWSYTYGDENQQEFQAVWPDADGGFANIGSHDLFAKGQLADFYFVKTECKGLTGCEKEPDTRLEFVDGDKEQNIDQLFVETAKDFTLEQQEYPAETIPVCGPTPFATSAAGDVRGNVDERQLEWERGSVRFFPNPVSVGQTITVEYMLNADVEMTVSVADALGRTVYTSTNAYNPGSGSINIPTEGWSAGSYVVTLTSRSGRVGEMIIAVE